MQAWQLQQEQLQPEAVIKNILVIFFSFVLLEVMNGCSSSKDVWTDENNEEYTTEAASVDTPDTAQQTDDQNVSVESDLSKKRFNVQADTLSVHSRKKTNGETAAISMRAAAPTKYYSVQIGAYTKKTNADRNYTITQKRFKLPMIRLYEGGIKMERICTGRFPTKKAAEEFLKKIQEQYPKEYTEAWVVMFKK